MTGVHHEGRLYAVSIDLSSDDAVKPMLNASKHLYPFVRGFSRVKRSGAADCTPFLKTFILDATVFAARPLRESKCEDKSLTGQLLIYTSYYQ